MKRVEDYPEALRGVARAALEAEADNAQWRAEKAEATQWLHAQITVEGEDPDIRRWKEDPFLLRGM
jgi:hypothetical protein